MPFNLHINISGLCLFIPRPATEDATNGHMHVVFPRFRGAHHGSDRHIPVIGFDAAHLDPRNSGFHDALAMTVFRGYALRIGAGESAAVALPQELANLRDVTDEPLDPDVLGPNDNNKVVARLTLGAGRLLPPETGHCWRWRTNIDQPMANVLDWTVEQMDGDRLELVPLEFDGTPVYQTPSEARKVRTLYPVNVDGVDQIRMLVHHVPAGDLPLDPEEHHAPCPGYEPHHFRSYFEVFTRPVPPILPRYAGIGCRTSGTVSKGGSPFNCMGGAVWP